MTGKESSEQTEKENKEENKDDNKGEIDKEAEQGTKEDVKPIEPKTQTTDDKPLRKRPLVDDKNRNKRMFGHLMSSLGKSNEPTISSSKSARNARRRDLESRAENRQLGNEKMVVDNTAKSDAIEEVKSLRQERELLRTHKILREEAQYFKTKETPSILYLPYNLNSKEQESLESQKLHVESQIKFKDRVLRSSN